MCQLFFWIHDNLYVNVMCMSLHLSILSTGMMTICLQGNNVLLNTDTFPRHKSWENFSTRNDIS